MKVSFDLYIHSYFLIIIYIPATYMEFQIYSGKQTSDALGALTKDLAWHDALRVNIKSSATGT